MRLISLVFVAVVFIGCKKKDDPENDIALKNGMLVLTEGLFQQNNSALGFVNFTNSSSITSFFQAKNNRPLGDTGNDLQRYGGKIYIVVNVSSTIEVISAKTGNSIKQIEMVSNGVAKQPRSIAFNNGKAYVTCYDGFVDVIDTNSLNIVQRIQVGANPEGLVVSNNRLFVANSGGLNFPNVDSTVSVIDLATNTEIQKIVVGKNPGDIEVDAVGDVYAISRGDYANIPSRMHRINPTTMVKEETYSFDASEISVFNFNFLISYSTSGTQGVALFNPGTEQLINANYLDLSTVQTTYEVAYNEFNNKIYVADAMDYTVTGFVHEFDASGVFIQKFGVGLNPSKMVFLK